MRVDIVIYEGDYLTRALLQERLSQAGCNVRFARSIDMNLDDPADLAIVSPGAPAMAPLQRDESKTDTEMTR